MRELLKAFYCSKYSEERKKGREKEREEEREREREGESVIARSALPLRIIGREKKCNCSKRFKKSRE